MPSYVYLLSDIDADRQKIGVSDDPAARCKGFALPTLEVVWTRSCMTRNIAFEIESTLHQKLDRFRLEETEWFRLPWQLVAFAPFDRISKRILETNQRRFIDDENALLYDEARDRVNCAVARLKSLYGKRKLLERFSEAHEVSEGVFSELNYEIHRKRDELLDARLSYSRTVRYIEDHERKLNSALSAYRKKQEILSDAV